MTRDLFGALVTPADIAHPVLYEMDAEISDDRKYRFSLTRIWDRELPRCCWIMLNPSYADALKDDPTIRKCVAYAKRWGYGSLVVVNISPYRSTDPSALRGLTTEAFVGPRGTAPILDACRVASLVICAWGRHVHIDKSNDVRRWLVREGVTPHALEFTNAGHPKHPLYLKGDLRPEPWL